MITSTLYNRDAVRWFDQQMINHYVDNGYQLMTQAAQSVMDVINQHYPKLQSMLIFCGQGNNAGDGYVLARLAKQQNINVQLVNLADVDRLKGDAFRAYQDWINFGGVITPLKSVNFNSAQLIIDALIGTGLDRELDEEWLQVVESINQSTQPVVAIDIPSGLDANTGSIWGGAVKAHYTITFIGLKQGLYTGQAREYCGEIIFKSLGVPQEIYAQKPSVVKLLKWSEQRKLLPRRHRCCHKSELGKVLLIGGNRGYSGAIRIAAEAALRSGAGLVKVVTHPDSFAVVSQGRPELMVSSIAHPDLHREELDMLFEWADCIAIGPGLGQDDWSNSLLVFTLTQTKPKVLDADALNLLAQLNLAELPFYDPSQILITPHPGEAARLLKRSTHEVESDRYQSIQELSRQFAATVILKGAGTLIAAAAQSTINTEYPIRVCPYGNPGMASGGMGDSLTGIVATLLNQTGNPQIAAELAVSLHAKAADIAAQEGESGLLASDLLLPLRELINSRY